MVCRRILVETESVAADDERSTRSVLWVADQRDDILPTRCVVSGDSTDGATRVWAVESGRVDWLVGALGIVGVQVAKALGKDTLQIALPVTPRWFGIWQRRAQAAVGLVCFGAAALALAVATTSVGWLIVGLMGIALGLAVRLRAFFNYWISAELRPKSNDILIRRSDPQFDVEAKRIYIQRLNRGR